MTPPAATAPDAPRFRYNAVLANEIEAKWQDRWDRDHTFWTPNATGKLADGFEAVADRRKLYALDMFPYPSGAGLHVGHPLGYIGTDVYARFMRMRGHNVLRDGLRRVRAARRAVRGADRAASSGDHRGERREHAPPTSRARVGPRLAPGHRHHRPDYYRWTQWIFLQIFGSWYDEQQDRARPIADLVAQFDAGERAPESTANPDDVPWVDLDVDARRRWSTRTASRTSTRRPVNWCPALGTVLANEEVTADGRSERGNHPVFRRPLKQWMLRITAYADRLLADLDLLDWPESIKIDAAQLDRAQRGRGGRVPGRGARRRRDRRVHHPPDTLFGATYMVLAPEHPLVEQIAPTQWPDSTPAEWRATFGLDRSPVEAVTAYRQFAAVKSELERQAEGARRPASSPVRSRATPTGSTIPVFVADYVLMGYGTGAIMAVPAHDQRDFEFA